MNSSTIEKIIQLHKQDYNQLNVVISKSKRIIVEAPAGCGKTTTMASKIAYMIANNDIPCNKKILGLTFSVNAAFKMKKELQEKLPIYGIEQISKPSDINKYIIITNYHGFARQILKKYGYLICDKLRDIYDFDVVDDNCKDLSRYLQDCEIQSLSQMQKFIQKCDYRNIDNYKTQYNDIIIKNLIDKKFITFNGLIFLVTKLLHDNEELTKFYNKLFNTIIIDEFQDTNYLNYIFLQKLIDSNTRLYLFGDSLQRIYGFIGAMGNIMEQAKAKYNMEINELPKNYRFLNNKNMLLLDNNIRINIKAIMDNNQLVFNDKANVKYVKLETPDMMNEWIKSKIEFLLQIDNQSKIAILVQNRLGNISKITEYLQSNGIQYFHAIFNEDDNEYIEFHKFALELFSTKISNYKYRVVSKEFLSDYCKSLKQHYESIMCSETINSLLKLTFAFCKKVVNEYRHFSYEEKLIMIQDTFINRSLKQNMDLIDSNIICSTIHGAKGLEWDYVIIPDMNKELFPYKKMMCESCCINKSNISCALVERVYNEFVIKNNKNKLIDMLSLFYVACTRAKKDIWFLAIKNKDDSCLMHLPGIAFGDSTKT